MTRFSQTMAALLVVALTGWMSAEAHAGGKCDAGCGAAQKDCGCGKGGCGKVLKLVCVDREIEVDCWACVCDEIVIYGKSTRGCRNDCYDPCAEDGKGKDGGKGGCGMDGRGKKICWYDWEPGCAKTKVVKKLYKKTVIKTVPAWEWQLIDESKAVKGYDGPAGGSDGSELRDPPEVRTEPSVPTAPVVDVHVGSLDRGSYDVQQASATAETGPSLYHQIKDLIK